MNQTPTLGELDQLAAQLKVLAHPTRLLIIQFLSKSKKTEATVTEIYKDLDIVQAIASQHLITLKDRGVLASHKVGTKIYYSIAQPWVVQILSVLQKQKAPDHATARPAST